MKDNNNKNLPQDQSAASQRTSGILSPAGSYHQVHPSAPQSPFIVSPNHLNAFDFHTASASNDEALREFTVYYALEEAQGRKLRNHSITFAAVDAKIVRQWVTTLNDCIAGKLSL